MRYLPPVPFEVIAVLLVFSASSMTLRSAEPGGAGEKAIQSLPTSGERFAEKDPAKLRVLMVGGGSSHDFEKFFHQADQATFRNAQGLDPIYTANAEEAVERLAEADVLVLSANHASFGLSLFQNALQKFADSGKGVVVVHAGAWNNWPPASGFNSRFVGGGTPGHGKGTFSVTALDGISHPLLKEVPASFEIQDELYRPVLGKGSPVSVLAETSEDPETGKRWPSVWVVNDAKAKIACMALGHGAEAHGNPAFQRLLVNAVRWAGAKP
jgi:type 1 glutamine amidotransferase